MSNNSNSYNLLDKRIQYWIWINGWQELRDIQEQAIPVIIEHNHDVVLSSGTASGKTEAAFFPILSYLLQKEESGLVVYISPLVALINDQARRLEAICEPLEIPVYPWHGGISSSTKRKFLKNPNGILLITPESLEALFCTKGYEIPYIFNKTQYIVIDELHAFIGTDRGKQLQTQIYLIEESLKRTIPRIGLSATLGDMSLAASFLRKKKKPIVIVSNTNGNLQLTMKGYLKKSEIAGGKDTESSDVVMQIVKDIFTKICNSNNLVFPNSKNKVEQYCNELANYGKLKKADTQFFAHHGNLSHPVREEAEQTIKESKYPTTIVCTNTLELGIDIGSVESIVQIGSPPSVASLRQRLGRSGREKNKSSKLWAITIENELDSNTSILDELRVSTFEFCAIINLLLDRWCEPPKIQALSLSTFVQQILALIAQHGGISVVDAYTILCIKGPFDTISKQDFMELLKSLAFEQLITQDNTGKLFHGEKGEQLVNNYHFYAAFDSEKEYRIVSNTRFLGTLPIKFLLYKGDCIIFGGKPWLVVEVEAETNTINVIPQHKGKAPTFNSSGFFVHTKIRQAMRMLYEGKTEILYGDATVKRLINEGCKNYQIYNLTTEDIIQIGSSVYLFTWMGDDVNEALGAIFRWKKYMVQQQGTAIELTYANKEEVLKTLMDLKNTTLPPLSELLSNADNLERSKWDYALSRTLLERNYESTYMDIDEAYNWIKAH